MGRKLGTFESTAYGPPWDSMNGTGVTANGTDLRPAKRAYGVAVDPNVIPLGTKLRIQPNPFGTTRPFVAFDTGGAIQGNRIDFYDWRGRGAQMKWGRRTVQVEKTGLSNAGLGDFLNPFNPPGFDPGQDSPLGGESPLDLGLDGVTQSLNQIAAAIGVFANALTVFLNKMGTPEFWKQAGKVALGLWLLMMGLRRIFYLAT